MAFIPNDVTGTELKLGIPFIIDVLIQQAELLAFLGDYNTLALGLGTTPYLSMN